ncbi:protein phosphatase 2C [Tritrichomonas foetus]|uniref:Protein phosphatase 2C n=1 Tax=Tritrichomonas foetus TaxID=1144522 RepID=A0A1J4JJ09_9EUKA|nr:protein phosphatase 2C [Tritrichomonas foetus]|eukprot:OHS98577.1 protein phosphatase 2C [Tritrichomonas foetus]
MGHDSSKPYLEATKRSISLRNEGLTSLPMIIPPDHQIESIDISLNKIRKIPTNLPSLHFFDFSENQLKHISKDIENAILSYPSLSELHLAFNDLQTIPTSFSSIPKLQTLYLNNNKFSEYSIEIPSVAVLDLSCNLLKSFRTVPESLSTLNLSFNRMTQIEFMSSNLRELIISGNDIVELPSNVCFDSLTMLNICHNKLKSINNIANFAPSLEILNASFNYIDTFPEILPKDIQILILYYNRICEIPPLTQYSSLTVLRINNNYVKNIPQLPISITQLSLENNRIESSASITLTSMQTLAVFNNNLTDVPHFTNSSISNFYGSSNLISQIKVEEFSQTITRIELASNNITKLPGQLFTLPELTHLIVYSNKINEIPREISMSHITMLNIGENPISTLPRLPQTLGILVANCCEFTEFPETVSALSRIAYLDFSNNKIPLIPFLPRAETLIFSCNKITKFPVLPENIHEIDLSHNQIKMAKIDHTHEYFSELDLSFNELESISLNGKLPALSELKLSNNPKLSFLFSYSKFKALECLDISFTKVEINSAEPARKMREIIRSKSSSLSPLIKVFNDNQGVGYAEMKGRRDTMEDSLILQKKSNFDLYAVIDGHAGNYTSMMTAFKLPQMINKFSVSEIVVALKDLNNYFKYQKVYDGATLALALKSENKIIAVNIGDSRTLIVRKNGTVFPLSYDHKPYERSEMENIREKGAFVADMRTCGILAISRSLGDISLNGVSAIPCINSYTVHEDDYRLVIACDGVFDVVTNEEVGEIVASEESASVAAYKLRNIAYARLSEDNISAIVVDLHKCQ